MPPNPFEAPVQQFPTEKHQDSANDASGAVPERDEQQLSSAKILTFPLQSVKNPTEANDLWAVTDPKDLKNITWGEDFSGTVTLNHLRSAQGVEFPKRFKGNLILRSLESAKGLVLPDDFEGKLDLDGLVSADYLSLPTNFQGDLYIRSIASLGGLAFPRGFSGRVHVGPRIQSKEINTAEIAVVKGAQVEFVFYNENQATLKPIPEPTKPQPPTMRELAQKIGERIVKRITQK